MISGQLFENVILKHFDAENEVESGTWTMIICAKDNHEDQARDNKPDRMVAVNIKANDFRSFYYYYKYGNTDNYFAQQIGHYEFNR